MLYLVIARYVVEQVLTPAVMRGAFLFPSVYAFFGMGLVLVAAFSRSERFHGFLMVFFWLLLLFVLVSFRGRAG